MKGNVLHNRLQSLLAPNQRQIPRHATDGFSNGSEHQGRTTKPRLCIGPRHITLGYQGWNQGGGGVLEVLTQHTA